MVSQLRSHRVSRLSFPLSVPQLVVSILLGLCFATAWCYIENMTFVPSLEFLLCLVGGTSVFAVLFWALDHLFLRGAAWSGLDSGPFAWALPGDGAGASELRTKQLRNETARVALVLFLFWVPYLVLMYPGNLSNDTTGQLSMFYTLMGHGERWLTTHHPVFDTLVFGLVTYPFYLAGGFRMGVFVCILLQEFCTSFAIAFSLGWARRCWGASRGLICVLLVFMAVCPVIPLVVASLSKDTFFSWIYVLWLTMFLDTVRKGSLDRRHIIWMTLLCALMCLTKKFGFYVVLLSMLAGLLKGALRWRSARKTGDNVSAARTTTVGFLVLTLASMLVAWGVMPALESSLGAKKGNPVDTIIVPIQQTAMCYSRHPDDYSKEDLEIVRRFVYTDAIDKGKWNPQNTDSIKQPGQRRKEFLRVWAKMGISHLGDYIDGWVRLEAPLFTFDAIVPLFDNHWHTWSRPEVIEESNYEKPALSDVASKNISNWYKWLKTVPGVNLLISQALYAIILPLFALAILASTRRLELWLAFVPVLVSFMGLLISPMVQPHFETMRYLLPFVYTSPLLVTFIYAPWNKAS